MIFIRHFSIERTLDRNFPAAVDGSAFAAAVFGNREGGDLFDLGCRQPVQAGFEALVVGGNVKALGEYVPT